LIEENLERKINDHHFKDGENSAFLEILEKLPDRLKLLA